MNTTHRSRPPDFEPFADVLGTVRHVLDHLLFKAITLQLTVRAGEGRFVAGAAAELEQAIRGVRAVEELRHEARTMLATELGMLPDELSLSVLIHRAPTPFDLVFEDHANALSRLVTEIWDATDECVQGLTNRMEEILRGPSAADGRNAPDRFDLQVEYLASEQTLRTLDQVLPPGLVKHLI